MGDEAVVKIILYYRSVLGKRPLPGKRPCTAFQGVNVAASIYTNIWNFDPSQVSAHAGQNHELCLSAHGCLPGTLLYV